MSARRGQIADWEGLARLAAYKPANMARHRRVTLRHLERIFQDEFGKTLRHWTRELQCRLAKECLAQGWSTKAVAQELGFANASHLCREFKKAFGMSTVKFRAVLLGKTLNKTGPTRHDVAAVL